MRQKDPDFHLSGLRLEKMPEASEVFIFDDTVRSVVPDPAANIQRSLGGIGIVRP